MSEDFWRDHAHHAHHEPWAWEWRRGLLLGELEPGERWLDLGCGLGDFTSLAPNGVGVDVSPTALESARARHPRTEFAALEDGSIPLGHGEVSLVWCSHVLEHVPDVLALLFECRRVLAPGGRMLATTPWAHPWRRLRGADPLGQHVRFFTPGSLRRALDAAGFEQIRVRRRRGTLVARAVRP